MQLPSAIFLMDPCPGIIPRQTIEHVTKSIQTFISGILAGAQEEKQKDRAPSMMSLSEDTRQLFEKAPMYSRSVIDSKNDELNAANTQHMDAPIELVTVDMPRQRDECDSALYILKVIKFDCAQFGLTFVTSLVRANSRLGREGLAYRPQKFW